MSRLGKKPVSVPSGVEVAISGRSVTISKGDSRLTYEHRAEVAVAFDADAKEVRVTIDEKDARNKQVKAYWGLTRALLANMVEGVTKGYEKKLEVVGVGYSVQMKGTAVALKCGTANTVEVPILPGLDVKVDGQNITIKGADKQAVGQLAAKIRGVRPPEPYNGKGIKYHDEVVRRKQGKAFGS
ncbi:MAG: 50S ribosomal protein L6 [Planctomycetota bacterium]